MAFIANNVQTNKQEEPVKAPLSFTSLDLSKQEIEIVLLAIKDMSFKGEHVEKVYNLVLKLQQHYTSLNR